jgi:nicotinamidase-related amidase
MRTFLTLVFLALAGSTAFAGEAPDIMREWATIHAPAPPRIAPVTIDPVKTALLVMDFNKANCTLQARARCVTAVPNVRHILDGARGHGVTIIHVITPNMKRDDIVDALAPLADEPILQVQGDKFHNSELEKMLQDRGITTVIAAGSSGNGAVLLTAIGGVSRGFNMVIPVDTMPSDSAYHEQFTIFEIADLNFLHNRSTLTRSDMIAY